MGCTFSGLNALYDAVNGGGDVWINENRFRIVRQLGEGGFAFVFLVKELLTNASSASPGLSSKLKDSSFISDDGTYAMKKVLIQNNEQLELVREEIRVSSLFTHPNLLPLLDHAIIKVKATQEQSWKHEAYLLFPVHLDGTLQDNATAMKAKKEFFSTSDVLQIFRQLCAGLKHMHNFDPSYAHNDVKPGNVLITHSKGQVPVAILMDFGSARPARRRIRSRMEALQLQILNWLEKGKFGSSGADFALRLDIIYKLKGLAAVEKYFDGIPSDLKNHSVYGGLLSCYTKALATFRKMDEMGFPPHVLAFNNLLSLFVKVNQPEKVSELVAEMKDKNVPPNGHSYSFWIQSYPRLGDLEGVERVFQEALEQTILKDDWVIYNNVATTFIELNQFEKAISCFEKLESAIDNSANTNRDGYHHLLSLYASAGKLESVIRVWNKLKAKFKVADNASSLLFLIALSKLDDIKCLETHFREWELSCEKYDDGIAAVLIGAYLKHDMLEEAKLLLHDATKKAGKTLHMPHVKFLNYYFEKGQTDCALHHMEAAISSKWKPRSEKLDPCFQHFKDAKDVEGVEIFCQLLKKAQALDARGYLWMLQTYIDAGKTALDMRSRMEEDGIDISPELEDLLEQVCPK